MPKKLVRLIMRCRSKTADNAQRSAESQLLFLAPLFDLNVELIENRGTHVAASGLSARKNRSAFTYNWTPLMMLPKRPIIPRNSTALKLRTTNSCPTFDTPYSAAPPKHNRSPSTLFDPSEISQQSSFYFECVPQGSLSRLHFARNLKFNWSFK